MKRHLPDFAHETAYLQNGYTVIGLDEVGRGCLSGPVTVGGVCFPDMPPDLSFWTEMGINDSKKLSPENRKKLYTILKKNCIHATATTDVQTINKEGIVKSVLFSMANVVNKLKKPLPDRKIVLLVDGAPVSYIPYINDIPRFSIIKGDAKCISIAAASIIAKVERDMLMESLGQEYPMYDWKQNKGYGTAQHRAAVKKYGVTAHHRALFVRKILKSF